MENRNDKEQVQKLDPEQLEKVSGGMARELVCSQCGEAFWSMAKLNDHIREKHPFKESSIIL